MLALGIGLGLLACPDREPPPTTPAEKHSPGRVLYATYCQSCHGSAGRGDGPAAGALRTPPADLTRLFERYGRPLDRKRLTDYIDGRQLLSAHGSREMPVWGDAFFDEAPATTPNLEEVKGRLIQALAEYVETLQADE